MQGDVEIRAYSMNNGSLRHFFRKGLKCVAIHEGSYAIYRDFIAQTTKISPKSRDAGKPHILKLQELRLATILFYLEDLARLGDLVEASSRARAAA